MLNINPNYYKDLPTLVNKEVEQELLKRTEISLYNLIKDKNSNINENTIKIKLNKMIEKLNKDANVKSFDIKLFFVLLENDKIECSHQNNNFLIYIEYLINNSNKMYDNRINDKILGYKNIFENILV